MSVTIKVIYPNGDFGSAIAFRKDSAWGLQVYVVWDNGAENGWFSANDLDFV